MKNGKRYAESAKLVDKNKEYEIKEALELISYEVKEEAVAEENTTEEVPSQDQE